MKKIKKRGKKLEEQIKKISALAGMVLLEGMMRLSVYAAEPQFVTGTKNLVADMTKYLLGAVAAVTGALLIKNGYQWNMAGEEEKPKHKKTFVSTLFIGVAILISGSLVTWIFSYYGG